jgi:hypothetical protein
VKSGRPNGLQDHGPKEWLGQKGRNKKIKEKGFLLFSEFIFRKRII